MATVVTTLRGSESNQGLSRSSNVVTVTRAASPTMNILVGDTVVISGVTPSSFNGTHTVTGVTGTTSFTYAQTDSDESSTVHGTTGGDYSLMSTWESTEQTDLVTDGDSHELHCYADWASGLSDNVVIQDWTTGASNTITVKAAAGHQHYGTVKDAGFWISNGAVSNIVSVSQNYTTLERLGVEHTSTSAPRRPIYIAGEYVTIDGCWTVAGNNPAIGCATAKAGLVFRNGLFINKGVATGAEVCYLGNQNITVQNCTAIGDSTAGFHSIGGTVTFNNCVSIGANTADFQCDGTATGSNNASGDTSVSTLSIGTVTGITSADFADTANDDYRITPDSSLYDAGTDLSGTFTTDIRGATRDNTQWDIGAFKIDIVTKTLRSSAGDYALMSTWESTEQTDLVAAGEQHVLDCYADWPTGLLDAVDIAGWATDAVGTITVKAAAGHEHLGVKDAGFWMRYASNGVSTVAINQDYVTLEQLQITHSAAASAVDMTGYTCTMDSCLVSSTSTGRDGLELGTVGTRIVFNSVFYDCGGMGAVVGNGDSTQFLNCTFVGNSEYGINIQGNSTDCIVKNCVAYGNTTADFGESGTGSWNAASTNNASGDTTASTLSIGTVTGITSTDFNNYAGGDYSPSSGSALINAGADLSSIFSDDIAGNTRG